MKKVVNLNESVNVYKRLADDKADGGDLLGAFHGAVSAGAFLLAAFILGECHPGAEGEGDKECHHLFHSVII